MSKKLLLIFVCSLAYSTPNYFLCGIAQSSTISCLVAQPQASGRLRTYSSSRYAPTNSINKPIFANVQTQLQHKAPWLLSYVDIDTHNNIYAKNLKHIKALSSVTVNAVSRSLSKNNIYTKFTMGTGMYLNLSHSAGRGGFAYYQNSTLSLENRIHFAASLILKHQHLLELSLQFPLFITGFLGYDATRMDNFLLNIRFVYGGKDYEKIQINSK